MTGNNMNVMLDLETLDTAPTSVILSIGLVAFNQQGITKELYLVPNLQDQIDMGRTISASTLRWWLGQSDQAKRVFQDPNELSVQNTSMLFTGFFEGLGKDVEVWSHGANFDVPMIEDFLRKLKMPFPWTYNRVRCFRTFCNERKRIYRANKNPNGTPHNALDDARNQANHVLAVWNGK